MLTVKNLTFGYDKPLITSVSFGVLRGEITAVLGRNGAGKSTLAAVLAGVSEGVFTDGVIEYGGEDLKSLSPAGRAAAVGVVFQGFDGQFGTRVRDELAFSPENLRLSREEIADRVRETAEACGIARLLDRRTETLSAGERQKTAIAAALMQRPALLIADEITAHLDERSKESVWEIMRSFAENGGAVLLLTHSGTEARAADKILDLSEYA